MKEPIMKFNNPREAYKCLDYWVEALSLQDWIIELRINQPIVELGTKGLNNYIFSTHESLITIYSHDNDNDYMTKISDEQTLVHELLHLILDLPVEYTDNEELASYKLKDYNHYYVDKFSKLLICQKYNLKLSWFNNFKRG